MRRFSVRQALQSGATGTGNGQILDTDGLEFVCIQIQGITTATVTFEATIDGTTWVAVLATNQTTGAAASTTATADGLFGMNCAGYALIRARISAYTSGTINVTALGVGG